MSATSADGRQFGLGRLVNGVAAFKIMAPRFAKQLRAGAVFLFLHEFHLLGHGRRQRNRHGLGGYHAGTVNVGLCRDAATSSIRAAPKTYHRSAMRTANPAFTSATFSAPSMTAGYGRTMTIEGTIHRTGILLLCVLATALWTWNQFMTTRDPSTVAPYILIGVLGGFVMALVTVFKKEWSAVTAPIYALLDALFLGGLS